MSSKPPKMRAIEFNMLMTLIKLISDRLPNILEEYGMGNTTVSIIPSYPRDLTDMSKPSIIVRRVDTEQSKVAMGGFIGQYEDDILGYLDVSGMQHDIMYQFDVVGNSNSQTSIIISILTEEILNTISLFESSKFQLYDFTLSTDNPTEMGVVTIVDGCDVINLPDRIDKPNANRDYISIVRQNFNIIQTVIPAQESIDLTKWIKQSFTIK